MTGIWTIAMEAAADIRGMAELHCWNASHEEVAGRIHEACLCALMAVPLETIKLSQGATLTKDEWLKVIGDKIGSKRQSRTEIPSLVGLPRSLSVRARKAIVRSGLKFMDEITENAMIQVKHCGETTTNEILTWKESL